ncbi:hypothetical protein EMGBD1_10740 [Anaerolineaceae bacterium]|nr:hypothetical protein EMGBD1_10740 [Anaerolineaceae bacterium]
MLGLLGLISDGRVVLQTRRLQVPRSDFLTVCVHLGFYFCKGLMLDQLAGYLQAAWAYVLREPVKVVLALGLVVPVVLIGLNNVRESSRQSAVEKELPQLVERIKAGAREQQRCAGRDYG